MMRYIAAFAALLFASYTAPHGAQAQSTVTERCAGSDYPVLSGDHQICSYTAQFVGTCNGQDMWNQWTAVNASPAPAVKWAITPWENHWIKIIGFEILNHNPGDGHSGWQIGSGYAPDMMGSLGPGQHHTRVYFPAGHVWMFPPIGLANDGGKEAIKDLHGFCTPGQSASVSVTFYYVSAASLVLPLPPTPICSAFNEMSVVDKSQNLTLSGGNLTVTGNGANVHSLVRAVAGIAPNTGSYHFEVTMSNQGSAGAPINVVGVQDNKVPTDTQVGSMGDGVGRGYNAGVGYNYSSGFTPSSSAAPTLANGTYAFDVNSNTGEVRIIDPSGGVVAYKKNAPLVTLYPALSMYGANSGQAKFNFSGPFVRAIPPGYQGGVCR